MSYEQPGYEELAKDTLERMMSDISRECWCSAWMRDLEFSLWDALTHRPEKFGLGTLEERDLARMKYLHELAGGWWTYPSGQELLRFVSTDEWLATVSRRVAP
ncbi:MAG TPA: hypothetical protein VMQ56_10465 [Terracidiphilus sp.]|jgi:uncharacterized protein YcaQ|nr:hypothetical protein [Terracidiphilus sp.]